MKWSVDIGTNYDSDMEFSWAGVKVINILLAQRICAQYNTVRGNRMIKGFKHKGLKSERCHILDSE